MMRIVSTAGGAHLHSRAYDGAIHDGGENAGAEYPQLMGNNSSLRAFKASWPRGVRRLKNRLTLRSEGRSRSPQDRCSRGSPFREWRCRNRRSPTTSNPKMVRERLATPQSPPKTARQRWRRSCLFHSIFRKQRNYSSKPADDVRPLPVNSNARLSLTCACKSAFFRPTAGGLLFWVKWIVCRLPIYQNGRPFSIEK